ncbi:hypothetical protein G7Y89_g111 [Cudoniella acicularis]|uniref:Uncharacterized protein n=1 Tax=Cudoniella acicularis TaxID=354080 RepID=A0A8H4RYN7_9HELO|nr:hypothetical protein G7Y89_g111 [Cudoniella acicularis]
MAPIQEKKQQKAEEKGNPRGSAANPITLDSDGEEKEEDEAPPPPPKKEKKEEKKSAPKRETEEEMEARAAGGRTFLATGVMSPEDFGSRSRFGSLALAPVAPEPLGPASFASANYGMPSSTKDPPERTNQYHAPTGAPAAKNPRKKLETKTETETETDTVTDDAGNRQRSTSPTLYSEQLYYPPLSPPRRAGPLPPLTGRSQHWSKDSPSPPPVNMIQLRYARGRGIKIPLKKKKYPKDGEERDEKKDGEERDGE